MAPAGGHGARMHYPWPENEEGEKDRSAPEMARSNLSPRGASLRWPPQQPSKVVTGSQIAAPQEWRGASDVEGKREEEGRS